MKSKKTALSILTFVLICCYFVSYLFLSNNIAVNNSSIVAKTTDNLLNNEIMLLEPPNLNDLLNLNQNGISKWEELVLKVDQNQNGINDQFEQRLKQLSTSCVSDDEKTILTKDEIIEALFTKEDKSLNTISCDNIPLIIQFPDGDFESYMSLFESLGGNIKSIYEVALTGFAGSIDYNGLTRFCQLLNQDNKQFLIEEDGRCKTNLYYTSRNMNLRPYTWNTLGYTGDPYSSVAVIDTGIDDSHNMFTPGYSSGNFNFKIVGWRDEVSGLINPYDDNFHGSHCAGIVSSEGSPQYDGSSRPVSTFSMGLDYSFYYVYDGVIPGIVGASFNVTQAGNIDIYCDFDDYTVTDDVHIKAYLYRGNTLVDSYQILSTSWSSTLSHTATGPGEYFFKFDLILEDNDFDYLVYGPHFAFRGEIHWPFAPSEMGSGDRWKGVAPDTHLVGIKVLDDTGSGWDSDIIDGINWAITNRNTYNITTISMSLGGIRGQTSLISAVSNAVKNGIVTVVAAGNDGGLGYQVGSPGDADKVITVGAVSCIDRVTEYSSAGGQYFLSNTTKPDILAPGGSDFNQTMHSADTNDNDAQNEYPDVFSNEMAPSLGTSMATPAVAGAANLMIQAMGGHPNWNYTELEAAKVKAMLLMTATETYPLKREVDTFASPKLDRGGKDKHEGFGRINVDAAIEAYTRKLNINSNFQAWLASSATDPYNKHALGCYVNLIAGQNYNFHLLVPAGADFDLHLYNSLPTAYGEPIMEAKSTSATLGNDETILFTPETSGRYYLVAKAIAGEGNAEIIWNHTRLDGMRIAAVIGHGEDNPTTKYPDIIADLRYRGAIIGNITSTVNSSALSQFDVLWFDEQGSAMTLSELDAIEQWVLKGGSFLVTGDDNAGSANSLIQRFNISYVAIAGSGSTSDITPHPITVEVAGVNFPSPTRSLDISLQPNANSCVRLNGFDTVVAMEYGNGKLVVIIDPNVLINYALDDNLILINNTFSWFGSIISFAFGDIIGLLVLSSTIPPMPNLIQFIAIEAVILGLFMIVLVVKLTEKK